VVCDEFSLFRRQLVLALEEAPDVEVMAEAGDADLAIEQARRLTPDVVLLGVHLPPTGGVRAGAAIRAVLPTTELVIILDPDDDTQLLRGVNAGASAFVPRESVAKHAAMIVRACASRRPILTRAAAKAVLDEYARLGRTAGSVQQQHEAPALDDREQVVLEQLAAGESFSHAADALEIDAGAAATLTRNALLRLERHARLEGAAAEVGARAAAAR
jgi:DNA-binding NarL/FixJ family response regulator